MGGKPVREVTDRAALTLPTTRAALRRHFRRSATLLAAGLVVMFTGFGLTDALGYDGEGDSLGEILTFTWTLLGFAALVVSLFCLGSHVRKGIRLGRAPWSAWTCRTAEVQPGGLLRLGASLGGQVPNPHRILVLGDSDEEPPILVITGNQLRTGALDACNGGEIWVAGDPRRPSVVSLPGGARLFGARRPFREGFRRRAHEEIRAATSAAR